MKICYIDFEFNRVVEPNVNLVCCATWDKTTGKKHKWWVHNDKKAKQKLKEYLQSFDIFICYSAVAECRSFISLGLDPLRFKWIDEFYEYRCVSNHNDRLVYGKQLVMGRVKTYTKPRPKWEREVGEPSGGFSPTHSLLEATFKLTGKRRDGKHKDEMRDLIISDPKEFTEEQKKSIMDYCMEDVESLPEILEEIKKHFKKCIGEKRFNNNTYISEAVNRGRYAALTSIMENRGYPIDVEKTKNFSRQVGNIIYDMQREINGLFPDIKPFRWNRKEGRFSENQANIREWIATKSGEGQSWPRTATGQIQLALEAFTKYYNFQHDYPKDNFGAQMVRYLKLKQNIYGFSRSKNKDRKNFWDSVGSDGRVRPYLNPFKAQSSRSQPAASGFMFLKPAWMRALVVPARGKFMAGVDYGSQEFFLSALLSEDDNMINSYLSGDPYLAFGKLSGQIPKDGTKKTHGPQRDLCKSTVLGISYLMTKFGLAIKLTADTGEIWTEEEAEEQINLFYEAYPSLKKFQDQSIRDYKSDGYVKLPCGWYMMGDNENFRSVANMKIQGLGASIMRKAVDLAMSDGIYVPFTLHDALYMEDDIGNEWKIERLMHHMREAFVFYLPKHLKEKARKIKLDPFAWSPNYKPDSEVVTRGLKIPCSNLYVDERSIKDYKMFSKYFLNPKTDLL